MLNVLLFPALWFLVGYVSADSSAADDHGINAPCPPWSEWKESDRCVSPFDLKCQVWLQCSRRSSSQSYSGYRGYSSRFSRDADGQMSRWSPMSMRWNALTAGRGSSFNRGNQQFNMGRNSAGSNSGTRSLNRKRSLEHCAKVGTHFKDDNMYFDPLKCLDTCGSCSIRFRCRSRDESFGCSPPVEVEKINCDKGQDTDACEMPMEKCNKITNKRMLSVADLRKPSRLRALNSGAQPWSKTAVPKTCGRKDRAKRFALDDIEIPDPDLNCVPSPDGSQCHCCCAPNVPTNGTCVFTP